MLLWLLEPFEFIKKTIIAINSHEKTIKKKTIITINSHEKPHFLKKKKQLYLP